MDLHSDLDPDLNSTGIPFIRFRIWMHNAEKGTWMNPDTRIRILDTLSLIKWKKDFRKAVEGILKML